MLIPPIQNELMHMFNVTHLYVCVKYPTIYVNIQGHSTILVTTHIYTSLKGIHIFVLKALCQNYTYSHPKYFAITNYLHIFEVLNIQIFVVSLTFIHMHIGKLITSCTYLHLKRKFHAIYIHLRDNSTSYIHLGSVLRPFLTWVHFLKGS